MKPDLGILFMTRRHNKMRKQQNIETHAKRSKLALNTLDSQSIRAMNANVSSVLSSKVLPDRMISDEEILPESINPQILINSSKLNSKNCTLFSPLAQSQSSTVGFPKTFNPRKEANMDHKEKVGQWIMSVPIYPSTVKDIWFNGCYSSLDPLTDQVVDFLNETYDFSDFKDVIQFQSQLITLLTNKLYWIEPEPQKDPESVTDGPAFLNEYNGGKIHVADHFVCQQSSIRFPLNNSDYIS